MTRTSVPAVDWAGNVTFRAARVHHPASVAQLGQIVAGARRVRALGTGHSFSRVADTTGDLVCLDRLPGTVDIDPAGRTVTLAAGISYAELAGGCTGPGSRWPAWPRCRTSRWPGRWPPGPTAPGTASAACRQRSAACGSWDPTALRSNCTAAIPGSTARWWRWARSAW